MKPLSPAAECVHSAVSSKLAASYISALADYRMDCGYRFPTLGGLVNDLSIRSELRESFERTARRHNCARLQPRWEVIEAGARWQIKQELSRPSRKHQAVKLLAIRAQEYAKLQEEIRAEQAAYPVLPL